MLLALHAGRAARRRDGVELAAEADAAAVAATLRMLRLIFGERWDYNPNPNPHPNP